ncbi:MAG TPA: PfkB family carbohydrate kinase [Chloroflexota bacterium]|nr:PfkB family carbohydrate kinase [Chloroflexota bacterium]
MSLVVVGSMALDTVKTPFGEVKDVLGGAATFFSLAASQFTRVHVVAVVGEDFPEEHLDLLRSRNIDVSGVQRRPGRTFRWTGEYTYDLNTARTLDTQLGVFADFHPELPDHYRDADFIFLANIDPVLQLEVVRQMRSPRLRALDSMNFWIESKRAELTEAISNVDVVLLNEGEVREYAGTYNLFVAARRVLDLGPTALVAKKGENGAVLISPGGIFIAPAYPLESVLDPTGAGDSFAGGFVGYLASVGDTSLASIKRAMIHGSTIASFAVEDFSVNRLVSLRPDEVQDRFEQFRELMTFEESA